MLARDHVPVLVVGVALVVAVAFLVVLVATAADPADQRRAMVEAVRRHAAEGATPIAEATLEALASVPREEFVPAESKSDAYADAPLPIGHGQTISQPYIVALMTQLADLQAGEKVLEVGTGSGYQAAVLAKLGASVFTIEIVKDLAKTAADRLKRLGYSNVEVRAGDGYAGWPEKGPFDAILVTAAPDTVPPPLVEQLAKGGRLVIPVGPQGAIQHLTVLEKNLAGEVSKRQVVPVSFVPLTRER